MTLWTVAYQAPLSMEFAGQEYWSGLPFPSAGNLPEPASNPCLLHCRQVLYHLSHQGTPVLPGKIDHEILIANFRLKLKKVGETARSFRYHLNQIPYDYTVEVRNRFKGLDLIDRVPDELWNEVHDIV